MAARIQYVRNTSDTGVVFPTLALQLDPEQVAGIPADLPLPDGVVAARASDYSGPEAKAPVHGIPVNVARKDDPWIGEPSPALEPEPTEPTDDEPTEPEPDEPTEPTDDEPTSSTDTSPTA